MGNRRMSAIAVPKTTRNHFQIRPLTGVVIAEAGTIPSWVKDLASFRQWTDSEEFPRRGYYAYLNGKIWVDLSLEEFYGHNQVKQEFNLVVGSLVKQERLGRYVPDRMRLVHTHANLSCEPDACFVSRQTIQARRWTLVKGKLGGWVEMEGSPDMALEVLSNSSVEKDEVILKQLYAAAGIPEYWLVDVRKEKLRFEILYLTADGYEPVKPQRGGWLKSKVFGRSFRLSQSQNEFGEPEFTLEVR